MAESVSEIINKVSSYYAEKQSPEAEHKLIYDSSTETLEPVYFYILDLMNDLGLETEKYIDNFTSSPGSGHFAELGQRATIMQQQGSQMLGQINTVLRSVLNIIYDLKEFRIRLEHYDNLNLKNKDEANAALLSLKQIWLDKVDMNKQNSSIKAMAMQGGFHPLIDFFLVVKNPKDVEKLDVNDRVKRILGPRIKEFNIWLIESEKELRKRYELEKTYLKSQVNSLKLYSRWAKPYLKAAQQLEARDIGKRPELVKVFNTLILELSLLGKSKLKVKEAALAGDLPIDFTKDKFLRSLKRDYYSCILVDFVFRSIPQKIPGTSHYAFGGRVEVSFKAYALNEEEIEKIRIELEKEDIGDVLKLIEGTTTESLEQLQEEINFFSEEKEIEKSKIPKEESNPFLALIGKYEKKATEKVSSKSKTEIKKDDWIEKNSIRALAAKKAEGTAFSLFDIYKKAHGMASFT